MAVKGLLLIQGGRQTVVPDTKETRQFWQDYNVFIAKSSVAHKKYVTIIEADADLVEKYLAPKPQPKTQVPATAAISAREQQMERELSELKSMMLAMMNGNNVAPSQAPITMPVPGPTAAALITEQEFATFD